MHKIECPHCHKEFEPSNESYADLVNQVRNKEFNAELDRRAKDNDKLLKAAVEKAELLANSKNAKEIEALNKQITELKAINENAKKIQDMVVEKALADSKHEIEMLNGKLSAEKDRIDLAVSKAVDSYKTELNNKNTEIVALNNKVDSVKKDAELKTKDVIEKYKTQIEIKDQEIEKWKSYRYGDSTKDLGESLEKYCRDAFEEVRADAYPHAYFEKDNESVKEEGETKGSKGDFIFKDYSSDGVELVSILFDMKTEKDTTENKRTNESHLKKLDADRTKKGCEYAVLVSTLEEDSKLYNRGIVDVSHKYQKMFVVRPQFFLAIIGLIRNLSLKNYEYKKQIVVYRNEHLDISNFEESVKGIAAKIASDYGFASEKYEEVDKMCEDIIKKVNNFREAFRIAKGHIGTAQNRLDDLSIRKLTKNNPTMKEKFDNLKKKEEK